LHWSRSDLHGSAIISISDEAGHELRRYQLAAATSEFRLSLAGYAAGSYFITLTIGNRSATTRLVVQN
jgi:hypothetical protein